MNKSLQIDAVRIDEKGIIEIDDCSLEAGGRSLSIFSPLDKCSHHLAYKVNDETSIDIPMTPPFFDSYRIRIAR
jgi:hypothetical protein